MSYTEIRTEEDLDCLEQNIKELCKIVDLNKRKSCLWNFVKTVKENHIYMCNFCNKNIAISPYRLSNIKRHFNLKHELEYSLIQKYMVENNKGDMLFDIMTDEHKKETDFFQDCYFEVLNDDSARCKICSEIVSGDVKKNSSSYFNHIKENHSDEIVYYVETPTTAKTTDNDIDLVLVQEAE